MSKKSHSHSASRQKLSVLKDRLRSQSRRVTGPRAAILEILRKHAHPLTIREVLAAMPKGQCDLATIYRSMHLLKGLGLVKQFEFGDGAARFELVSEADDHHHHLVCTRCSEIVEIEDCFVAELEKRIAAKNGFKAVTHKLEFFGICPECQEDGCGRNTKHQTPSTRKVPSTNMQTPSST